MRGFETPEPTGNSRLIQWARATWERTQGTAAQFISTSTVKVVKTSRGIAFHAAVPRGGGAAAPMPSSAVAYTLVSMRGDYWIGQPFNANPSNPNDPSKNVAIAKQPELRLSVVRAVIDGQLVTYSSAAYGGPTNGMRRDATVGANPPIKQVITPRYILASNAGGGLPAQSASIIFAIPVGTSNVYTTGVVTDVAVGAGKVGDPVTWLEVSARAWSDKYDQST